MQGNKLRFVVMIFFVFHLQPENQEVISYSILNKDYPRYPSIFQCSLTEEERDKLMVCMVAICSLLDVALSPSCSQLFTVVR